MTRHFNNVGHTLILAPRRSGKSSLIAQEFYSEANSALVCINNEELRNRIQDSRDRARDWHASHSYSLNRPNDIRGKYYETVFVDEIRWGYFKTVELFNNLRFVTERIVAVSTPGSADDPVLNVFHNIVNVQSILDGEETVLRERVTEHFRGREDLFRI